MLRLGIGLGFVAVLGLAILGYGKRQYRTGYDAAKAEIAAVLNEDAAAKERAATEAGNAVVAITGNEKALKIVCQADYDCRDRKEPQP